MRHADAVGAGLWICHAPLHEQGSGKRHDQREQRDARDRPLPQDALGALQRRAPRPRSRGSARSATTNTSPSGTRGRRSPEAAQADGQRGAEQHRPEPLPEVRGSERLGQGADAHRQKERPGDRDGRERHREPGQRQPGRRRRLRVRAPRPASAGAGSAASIACCPRPQASRAGPRRPRRAAPSRPASRARRR